jgi:hypothetical protein
MPVDSSGDAIPWWTYPCIAWASERLEGVGSVFEWGAGQSSKWLSKRVASVRAVEHDQVWVDRTQAEGVEIIFVDVEAEGGDEAYVDAVRVGGPYEVIIVDGLARLRVACMEAAAEVLPDTGLMIVDDSHRPVLRDRLRSFADDGFVAVDFAGFRPGAIKYTLTTIMTRDPLRWLRPLADGATIAL